MDKNLENGDTNYGTIVEEKKFLTFQSWGASVTHLFEHHSKRGKIIMKLFIYFAFKSVRRRLAPPVSETRLFSLRIFPRNGVRIRL